MPFGRKMEEESLLDKVKRHYDQVSASVLPHRQSPHPLVPYPSSTTCPILFLF